MRPDQSVLLLVDVLNPFEFVGARQLFQRALPAARRIAALKTRLRDAGTPAIYVNDNFGRWDLDCHELVATLRSTKGAPIVDLLAPQPGDQFVLKPKHSGFYRTSLSSLLDHLQPRRMILTGFAADICVLFTANDAYMRGFEILVPSDCIAAESDSRQHAALALMRRVLKADTTSSRSLSLTRRASRGLRRPRKT